MAIVLNVHFVTVNQYKKTQTFTLDNCGTIDVKGTVTIATLQLITLFL